MLPSKSYRALLGALQKAESLVPRPNQTSSGDDWSLYLRLLKLLSSVQTLHRKAQRLETAKPKVQERGERDNDFSDPFQKFQDQRQVMRKK